MEEAASETKYTKTEEYIVKRRKSASEQMFSKQNKVAPALGEIKDEKVWYDSVVAAMPPNPMKSNSKDHLSMTSPSGAGAKKLKSKNPSCLDRLIELFSLNQTASGSVAGWAVKADHIVRTVYEVCLLFSLSVIISLIFKPVFASSTEICRGVESHGVAFGGNRLCQA